MKRKLTMLILGAAVLVAATAAFAYFSGQSSASKQFTNGSSPNLSLVIDSVNNGDAVYPGDNVPVAITVTNNSGHASGVGVIKAALTGAVQSTLSGDVTGYPGCLASWFSFANVPGGGALADGASRSYTGTLSFTDTGAPQDACIDAQPTLNLIAAP